MNELHATRRTIPALLACVVLAFSCGAREPKAETADSPDTALGSPSGDAEPPLAPKAASEPSPSSAARELADRASSLGDESALAAFEAVMAAISAEDLDALEALLETAVIEAERAARPSPSLRLALAACYGRKGLVDKAYAAIMAAEKDAEAPGVSFSLAVIHGRKALLAPAADAKPCTLVIESEPEGASIRIDGAAAGPAPVRLEAVRAGRHEIRAALAGYSEYVDIVEAGPGSILPKKAVLSPAPVPCSLDTEPSGAELWIDGGRVGMAPWIGELLPGRHSIEAKMKGYETSAETIDVPIASSPVSTLRLSPMPAILVVESVPTGGVVEFNGKEIGRTPQRIETKAFDSRYVSIRPLDGLYEPSGPQPIELRSGEETRVSVSFRKKSAPLGIKASAGLPAGAVVLVDGKPFDTVPTGGKPLEFGVHEIEIRADGFDSVSKSVFWNGFWIDRLAMDRILPKVPSAAIKVDGTVDDWAGVSPLFTDPSGDDQSPRVSGTDVVAVYAAADEAYLYVRMDFADGVFRASGSDWREQCLKIHGDRDGASQYYIYLSLVAEGTTLEPRIRVNKAGLSGEPNVKRVTAGCSFRNGDGLVEMRFPLSAFADYVKKGDVFNFWSHVGPDYPKGTDETERVDVRIR